MFAVASSPVPQIRFDSSSLPAGTALDRWRSNLSQSWDMSLVDEAAAPHFHADVSMWRMDGLLVGNANFGPTQTRMRREKNIRADQLDHYRVLLMRSGEFHCDADGAQVSLAPGQFVVTDMALPERSESACASAVAYVPRDMLDNALPRPRRWTACRPATPAQGGWARTRTRCCWACLRPRPRSCPF